jgi:hypothetical protein
LQNNLQTLPANGTQEPVPDEMSLTLLTNKKQGKMAKYTPLTLSSQPSFALINRKKYVFFSMEHRKIP